MWPAQAGRPIRENSRDGPRGRLYTWRSPIYAIVRSGGRQYRVETSQLLDVDRLDAEIGAKVDLGVLLLGGDGETLVGAPTIDGARVVAEVVEHGRGKKILVFKYKNKTRYRRRQGHRQDYTRLSIQEIVAGGKTVSKAEDKKTVVRPRSLAEPDAEEAAAVEAEATEVSVEATPKPRAKRAPKAKAEAVVAEEAPEVTAKADAPVAEPAPEAEVEAPATDAEEEGKGE